MHKIKNLKRMEANLKDRDALYGGYSSGASAFGCRRALQDFEPWLT